MNAIGEPPAWFGPALESLLARHDLDATHVCQVLHGMLAGELGEVELAALLIAWRMKGETGEELAAAAAVLRERMQSIEIGRTEVLDTCGTGGDGLHTFNISTATAIVVAATGVPIVKHGNRAVSSQSGSADVLGHLGVELEMDAVSVRRCLDHVGLSFCLAPQFHPALRHVGPVRRRLGVRTLFNCLGPLANPAGAGYQLLGVGRREWLDPMAQALARLRTRHVLLVHGSDGLDEVTLTGPTDVREVRGNQVWAHQWNPADFDLEPCALDELTVTGPLGSAAVVRGILNGQDGAARRIVLANAAAARLAADASATLTEGVERAAEAIDSGAARRMLEELVRWSRHRPEAE
jgi:anthranilate phosphoribosyltransferase